MPSLRNITIELRSQYDIDALPEYLATLVTTPTPYSSAQSASSQPARHGPTITVYVPILPRSQFFIGYFVSSQRPPSAYLYFKLFFNGAPIVSWGCGENDDYEGSTHFALVERTAAGRLKQTLRQMEPAPKELGERRAFMFPAERLGVKAGDDRVIEVKVYRSNGRKRVSKVYDEIKEPVKKDLGSSNIDLRRAGTIVEGKGPQRYYDYALLDAVNQPFATYIFKYRTWDELEELGFAFDEDQLSLSQQHTPTPRDFSARRDQATDSTTNEPRPFSRADAFVRRTYSSASDSAVRRRATSKSPQLKLGPFVQRRYVSSSIVADPGQEAEMEGATILASPKRKKETGGFFKGVAVAMRRRSDDFGSRR